MKRHQKRAFAFVISAIPVIIMWCISNNSEHPFPRIERGVYFVGMLILVALAAAEMAGGTEK